MIRIAKIYFCFSVYFFLSYTSYPLIFCCKATATDTKSSVQIGHSGIAQGTGASLNFFPIDKLTPPHERLRSGLSFDQV